MHTANGLFKENFDGIFCQYENINIHVRFDWQQQYLRYRILRNFSMSTNVIFGLIHRTILEIKLNNLMISYKMINSWLYLLL